MAAGATPVGSVLGCNAGSGAGVAARSEITKLNSSVGSLKSQVRSVESQRGQRQGVSKALERVGGVR